MRELLQQIFLWFGGARHRAQRRKSPWNLILIPLGLAFWFGIWCGLFRLVWAFHVTLYPQHNLQDFWRESESLSSLIPSFLMIFALMPGAICLGLALANCVAWLIVPARQVFVAESTGYPGAGFREATRVLFILSTLSVPAGIIIALLAAWALASL